MKIVVLNECFLSIDQRTYLKSLGEVEFFEDTTTEAKAIARLKGTDIALSDMYECPLNAKTMNAASNLKLLCINSTGFDLVDLQAAAEKRIAVCNTPGFSTEAVAEHVFALLLAVSRHIVLSVVETAIRPFQMNPADKTHYKYLGLNLAGKTIGIIGLGAIGSAVAKIAQGFNMRALGYNRSSKNIPGVETVPLDRLLAEADIVSLHVPSNA